MSGQVSRGSAGEYQADERAGVARQLLLEIENQYPNHRYELFTSTKSISNIRLYERLRYKIFKDETVSLELQFIYLEKW